MAEETLLSDDFLRQLINVGEVDLVVGVSTHNNAKTIGPVVAAIQAGILKCFPRERVASGIGFISALLGTQLPGDGSIFVSASIVFKTPVRIGDTVVTTATVREIIGREVIMDCACTVDGKQVLESEARVLAPRRPAAKV